MDIRTNIIDTRYEYEIPPLRASGHCFGTFGELLQGVLPNNRHFLVTLPINLKVMVEFEVNSDTQVTSSIVSRTKACRAVDAYLRRNNLPPGGKLGFKSVFPVGRGLASSSADMVAAIRAASIAHQREISASEIENILRDIEPTDGVMYEGIVSFYHREVALDEQLGPTPALSVVGACRPGECDTINFNKKHRKVPLQIRAEYQDLLNNMKSALRARDLKRIGQLATRSCDLSQAFNPMPHIETMHSLLAETEALGIIAAHSGTYLGLLFDDHDPEISRKLNYAQMKLRDKSIQPHYFKTV